MANGKLDPNFIAAPFYGESSYDPIQEMKQAKATLSQVAFQRRKQQETEMQKGLDRFDEVDIKSWEDQKGFDEISNELNELRSQWVDVAAKGMNLIRPENIGEQKLSKAFNQKLLEIKQKNDVWQRNKAAVDEYKKVIEVQKQKPLNDQTVDWAESAKRLEKYFTSEGNVLERSKILQGNLLMNKFQPADIGKYFATQFDNLIKGTDVRPDDIQFDPATGKTTITHREYTSAKRIDAAINKAASNVRSAPEDIRVSTEKAYEVEKREGETLEDWIRRRFLPEYASKERTTVRGGSGKGGLNFSFLGQSVNMKAGMEKKTPLIYGTGAAGRTYQAPWEFDSNVTFRIPIGAKGSSRFYGDEWEPMEGGGDLEGTLEFYDAERDEFLFRLTQSSDFPYARNNETIAVPRKNLGDRVDELKVEVDGVVKDFKDVFGQAELKYKSIGGKDFRTPGETPKVERKGIGGKEYKSETPYIPGKTGR
ncbi:MAG: hypothetical protein WC302_03515 [Candidatus Paceibacterota bacterium]|jgi:hypothetical protein